MGMFEKKKELAKVIEQYFGADAGYLDISCIDLARRILEAGYEKPVRCKDCKYYNREESECNVKFDCDGEKLTMDFHHYCSDGKRRSDGDG